MREIIKTVDENRGLIIEAVNALRETFKESDHVRRHPIMKSGGDSVNNIP